MRSTLRLLGLVACLALLAAGPASSVEAEKILTELKSNWALPTLEPGQRGDQEKVRSHEIRLRDALKRRVDLIGELYRVAPEHPMIRELMIKRWSAMLSRSLADRREELVAEVGAMALKEGNALRIDAAYFKALLELPELHEGNSAGALGPIDAFIALAPRDERGAYLLGLVMQHPKVRADLKRSLLDRILADYPDSSTARRARASQQASRRRVEGIGQPFELTFKDAVHGRTVSLQRDLKGKVVVIDFWATSCAPCVTEMPKLKALYSEYRGQGVEFIGVSLDPPDEKGSKALLSFVQKHQVDWPQVHGEAANELAGTWGVSAIPSVFVVDSKGKLHTVDGRGRLESLIPELLR